MRGVKEYKCEKEKREDKVRGLKRFLSKGMQRKKKELQGLEPWTRGRVGKDWMINRRRKRMRRVHIRGER